MTIHQSLKQALKGGYLSGKKRLMINKNPPDPKDSSFWYAEKGNWVIIDFLDALLDPKFWEALGVAEGWAEAFCLVDLKKCKRNPAFYADCVCHRESAPAEWKYHFQQLPVALIDGKTIEKYLKTL